MGQELERIDVADDFINGVAYAVVSGQELIDEEDPNDDSDVASEFSENSYNSADL